MRLSDGLFRSMVQIFSRTSAFTDTPFFR